MCLQWLAIKLTYITSWKNLDRLALRPKNWNSKTEILDLQENHKAQKFSKGAFW